MNAKILPPLQPGWGVEQLDVFNLHYCLVRTGLATTIQRACRRWEEELPGGGKVLDVGCGLQPYRPWIEAAGLRYCGIERDANATAGAKDVVNWDLMTMPWPFPDAEFDGVLCTEVLEHTPEPSRLLAECARVCKPGSSMLLTTPLTWPEHEAPYDFYRFTQYGLRRLLEEADFSVEEVIARGGWPTTLAQLIGIWACLGFSKPWSYLTRVLAWPVMKILYACERYPAISTPHLITLGYSVFARRRPAQAESSAGQ